MGGTGAAESSTEPWLHVQLRPEVAVLNDLGEYPAFFQPSVPEGLLSARHF